MSSGQAIGHFVAKWQAREPDMALAEVFVAPADRERFRAWGALVHELREAAFELSDARVTAVKCQWWAEELLGLAGGRSRHPLTGPLAVADAPWASLARAMASLRDDEARPADAAASLFQLLPLATALADTEAAVFGEPASPDASRAIAVHLRLQRLPAGLSAADVAGVPLNLMARHGLDAGALAAGQGMPLLRDWARELAAALPPARGLPLFRRLRTGLDAARLARLAAGRGFDPPAAPATVWRAWRLARAR